MCITPSKSILLQSLGIIGSNGYICDNLFACQSGESVLSALGGCKLLRELSKLEIETGNKRAIRELAKTFEKLAHGE